MVADLEAITKLEMKIACTRLTFCVPTETRSQDQEFSVYLGNVPQDVIVEKVWVFGELLLLTSEGGKDEGASITPVVHTNGSRAFQLRLSFDHDHVRWTVRTD